MSENKFEKFGQNVLLLILAVVVDLLLAWPIMWAWNYIIPQIFGACIVTWGQSFCLLFLSKMLIGRPKYFDKD